MIARRLGVALVRCYRLFISPVMGPHCRFYPTCSHYAEQAFAEHGLGKGLWLTLCRLGRCHPLCTGGFDPVPPAAASHPINVDDSQETRP